MILRFLFISLLASFFTVSAYSQDKNTAHTSNVLAEYEIPVKRMGLIPLPVVVDKREYFFFVDTGCTYTMFDMKFKEMLGTARESGNVDTPGGIVKLEVFDAPEAFLGPFCLKDYGPVLCADLGSLGDVGDSKLRGEFGGLLGMNFLKKHVIQIDLDKELLSFIRPRSKGDPNWGVEFPITYTQTRIPMIEGKVLGTINVSFHIDTGHLGYCALDNKARMLYGDLRPNTRTLGFHTFTLAGPAPAIIFRVGSFHLGPFDYKDLLFQSSKTCLLGLHFWSRHKVTFDFSNNRIFLDKGKDFNRAKEHDMSGILLVRRKTGELAITIYKDSPAENAGLKPGDVILDINGKKADSYSRWEVMQILRSGNGREIKITVKRGDEQKKVSLVLKREI